MQITVIFNDNSTYIYRYLLYCSRNWDVHSPELARESCDSDVILREENEVSLRCSFQQTLIFLHKVLVVNGLTQLHGNSASHTHWVTLITNWFHNNNNYDYSRKFLRGSAFTERWISTSLILWVQSLQQMCYSMGSTFSWPIAKFEALSNFTLYNSSSQVWKADTKSLIRLHHIKQFTSMVVVESLFQVQCLIDLIVWWFQAQATISTSNCSRCVHCHMNCS